MYVMVCVCLCVALLKMIVPLIRGSSGDVPVVLSLFPPVMTDLVTLSGLTVLSTCHRRDGGRREKYRWRMYRGWREWDSAEGEKEKKQRMREGEETGNERVGHDKEELWRRNRE